MKPEYKKYRDVMLDKMGRYRTSSLFWEYRKDAEKYPPLFTTKETDLEVDGVTYRSLKAIYFSYDHIPHNEYEFAMDVFGSWDHWIWITTKSQLKAMFSAWREELEIKIRANAVRTIITQSRDPEKGLAAARMIASGEHKGEAKRGRPSKAEVERERKIAAGVRDTLEEDMERLGLKVVK